MANLQGRSELLQAVQDLEGFDALEGATPAEKMQNLQARAVLLQAVQDLEGFDAIRRSKLQLRRWQTCKD